MSKIQVNFEFDPSMDSNEVKALLAFFNTLNGNTFNPTVESVVDRVSTKVEQAIETVKQSSEIEEPKEERVVNNNYEYSEEELKAMATNDILSIVKDLGIDPDKFEGKNTAKKLRDLILNSYSSHVEVTEDKWVDESTGTTFEDVVEKIEEAIETVKSYREVDDIKSVSEEPLKVEVIRALLNEKVDAHREAIVAKLRAFGAKNLTVLEADKHLEFYNYLKALK